MIGAPLAGAAVASIPNLARAQDANANHDLGARVYNIRDFGAVGDGKTLDTAALQKAIDAATADGGGIILVPAGTFLIASTQLKSNVTLRISAGATLLGTSDGHAYHAVDAIPLNGDSTLNDGNWALLYAVDAHNVTIEGPGTIDGNGAFFHPKVRGEAPPSGVGGNRRPYHFLCYHCTNLRINNLDLINCAYHSIRVVQSKFCYFDALHIHNRVNGNNDGFHFISAEFVTISNCIIQSQDDACALFGSCKNVTVTNSYFSTRWSVFRFGGGIVDNINVSNCVLHQVFGCPIKLHGSPGSVFQNMSFSNLILNEVTGPISISVGSRQGRTTTGPSTRPEDEGERRPTTRHSPGVIRNISFSNIHGTVTTDPPPLPECSVDSGYREGEKHNCITLNGVGDSILENITFSDIHLTFGGGGTREDAARRELPPVVGEYFVLGPMPAYGLYARNCRGITISNMRLQFEKPDLRPAVILDNVTDVAITGLAAQGNPQSESVCRFINVKDALLTAPRLLTPASVFARVEGTDNAHITIDGGDIAKAEKPLDFANGANESAVKLRA
jgi:hypothetical protein